MTFISKTSTIWPFITPSFNTFLCILMEKWNCAKFERSSLIHSMGWFYTVSPNPGGGPTPIWAGWDPKYLAHLTFSQNGVMGPSWNKIPDLVAERVFTTWKLCLLRGWEKIEKKTFPWLNNVLAYVTESTKWRFLIRF